MKIPRPLFILLNKRWRVPFLGHMPFYFSSKFDEFDLSNISKMAVTFKLQMCHLHVSGDIYWNEFWNSAVMINVFISISTAFISELNQAFLCFIVLTVKL